MKFETFSVEDYKDKMKAIFEFAGTRKVWLFNGDLGAGKTTFIQALLDYLGSEDEVTSPTFSLINEYLYSNGKIYHMDLYRIESLDEAINIGIEDYLNSGSFCFIEWPEIALPLFDDEDSVKIQIEILDMTRRKINLQ
jgi:tRNA threonylcarbamoyladenosine biosynthesis protein TsaE